MANPASRMVRVPRKENVAGFFLIEIADQMPTSSACSDRIGDVVEPTAALGILHLDSRASSRHNRLKSNGLEKAAQPRSTGP